mgnify:CR=1 FL=1|tara:strand:- start:22342 stop:25266 length:2925 start_codon:yes stop_codon:yes gene_type:complete
MESLVSDYDVLDGLMRYRVRDILLVSSPYDYFTLEQDGQLNELLLTEYKDLNLSYYPRITHARSGEEALQLIKKHDFDIVVTMARVGEMEVHVFATLVKKINPDLPVIFLAYNTRELSLFKESAELDRTFVWSGDARILLAIIKLIEDEKNVHYDTINGNVKVIILVENSIRFYSSYLPLLYRELLKQTRKATEGELNLHHKLLRMRARPKILLATTMEESQSFLKSYKDRILGIITDYRFPQNGKTNPEAGAHLIRRARKKMSTLPIMLQSSRDEAKEVSKELNVSFIDKEDLSLHKGLRNFMRTELGFGDFIFRLPNGEELKRVSNTKEMIAELSNVPLDSIKFHAENNHFSTWFEARTEFNLASILRSRTMSDFPTLEQIRDYLIEKIKQFQQEQTVGTIADYSVESALRGTDFFRVGRGSLGGKGRSLAFFNSILPTLNLKEKFPTVNIRIPRTHVITTDVFDEFIDSSNFSDKLYGEISDSDVVDLFLEHRLPETIYKDLRSIISQAKYPLAVRSSSLLEDSQHQPFAGVYSTYMLPNNSKDSKVRLHQLANAIKLVFASTFLKDSKDYIAATPNRIEEEKMAVVVQELCGFENNGIYYPTISGVARSYNHYPIGNMKPEEGVVSAALGLGKAVVEGEKVFRFSPSHPKSPYRPSEPEEYVRASQSHFWAVDTSKETQNVDTNPETSLKKLKIERAKDDAQLYPIGSIYSPENNAIYDGLSREGIPIVSFSGILKDDNFPFSDIINTFLKIGEESIGNPVEIEFAVNIDVKKDIQEFIFLQARPLVLETTISDIDFDNIDGNVILRSTNSLGSGSIEHIRDIIFIDPTTFDRSLSDKVPKVLEKINKKLIGDGRPYLLIGPGRWGSSDPWLGIPVKWGQISGARTIIECPLADIPVDPSQGAHFFQNIISFNVGYITLSENDDVLAWDWFNNQKIERSGQVNHIKLKKPLKILLDGKSRSSVILSNQSS